MARIYVPEDLILSFSREFSHDATDWLVYTNIEEDGTLGDLLFESLDDTTNLYMIISTLRYPDGTLYPPELGSVARVRLRYGDKYTPYSNKVCS